MLELFPFPFPFQQRHFKNLTSSARIYAYCWPYPTVLILLSASSNQKGGEINIASETIQSCRIEMKERKNGSEKQIQKEKAYVKSTHEKKLHNGSSGRKN